MGHAIRHAVARSGVEGTEVEDVVIGTALGGGTRVVKKLFRRLISTS
jgi:hypothetical protein